MAAVGAIAETTAITSNEEQLVTMIVDKQLFGVPILQVQDIVEATKITPVPLSTSAIAGMLNLRGRIVTLIDLRKLLGNDEEVPWESQMGVTVDYKGDLYTLLVDAIGDVRTVRRNNFDKAPSTLAPATRRLCSGIYRLEGTLMVVLDVSRILTSEVIRSTPVLTVAERRARKAAALEAAKDGESGVRQLTSHMTGLRGYDADLEAEAADQSADNIKQRKKDSRNRRPVAERWHDVMEERARKSGKSVRQVQEPDAETLEAAREEMKAEDSAWQARIKGSFNPVESGSGDAPGDLGELPDEMFSDEAFSDEAFSDEALSDEALADLPFLDAPDSAPDSASDSGPDLSGDPVSTDSLPGEMFSDEPISDEPVAGDKFALSDLAEILADEVALAVDGSSDSSDSGDSGEPPAADFMGLPAGEPAVYDASEPAVDEMADVPDMSADEPVVEFEPAADDSATADAPDMELDEPPVEDVFETPDDTGDDTRDDTGDGTGDGTGAVPEMPEGGDAPDNGKAGMLSGFWNKLRGPDKKAAADNSPAADEAPAFDKIPASGEDDETPISGEDDETLFSGEETTPGDEPVAGEEPETHTKPAKSASKKKASAKRKPAKSGKP